MAGLADNPFAVFSFLAAPAILTNASTVLALGTSNRLARAADRARLLSSQILGEKRADSPRAALELMDFRNALRRAVLLVRALRSFYLAAGSFAAGTCVSLIGGVAAYFSMVGATTVTAVLALSTAVVGVAALMTGAVTLVVETRLALRTLGDAARAIDEWRAREAV
jgi:hypothetical protein